MLLPNESEELKFAIKIYNYLLKSFQEKMKRENKGIVRPCLTNGKYDYQREIKKTWKLSDLKPKVGLSIKMFVP